MVPRGSGRTLACFRLPITGGAQFDCRYKTSKTKLHGVEITWSTIQHQSQSLFYRTPREMLAPPCRTITHTTGRIHIPRRYEDYSQSSAVRQTSMLLRDYTLLN